MEGEESLMNFEQIQPRIRKVNTLVLKFNVCVHLECAQDIGYTF